MGWELKFLTEVVLGDVSSAQIACPQLRSRMKQNQQNDHSRPVCAGRHCPPDVLLGNLDYGPDLDMWGVGCIAAELALGKRPFDKDGSSPGDQPDRILAQQFRLLGTPPKGSSQHTWFSSLPLLQAVCHGKLPQFPPSNWPADLLRHDGLADFVRKTLRLDPKQRMEAASACLHPLVVAHRALSVAVSAARAKQGLTSVLEGRIDEELLQFLQECPSVPELYQHVVETNFQGRACMKEEADLHMKAEFPGYLDGDYPPPCTSLTQ